MIKFVSGDIVEDLKDKKINGLVHGCNCYCVMGAGLAKQLADISSDIQKVDYAFMSSLPRKIKLGNYSHSTSEKNGVGDVFNLYSQLGFGRRQKQLIPEMLEAGLNKIKLLNEFQDSYVLGLPKIGCGLAGGNWKEEVLPIIKRVFSDVTYSVHVYGDDSENN